MRELGSGEGTVGADRIAGALLAGGQSRRMGREKALIELDGRPLWTRQLDTLKSICGTTFIVAPERPSWLPAEALWVPDAVANRGPLGGVAGALGASSAEYMVVLAVDLPAMTPAFLERLLDLSHPGSGVVPQIDGLFEPLAAIYPRAALPIALRQLDGDDHSMQSFLRILVAQDLMNIFVPDRGNEPLFRNLNFPGDLNDA